MDYYAGLLQGQMGTRRAARSAQEWKEIALRLEAELREAQLAALANKHVLEDAVAVIKQVAPSNQLANEAAVKALKFQYFEQEKQNRGW